MESKSAVQLYLELLKKTILFEIWLEYEAYLPASLHISKELEFEPVTVPSLYSLSNMPKTIT
ncbi:macrocin-O-methyltransferase [Bacillus cereus]|nr:macrocin-O-methyltransferase [Bacillus cereus]